MMLYNLRTGWNNMARRTPAELVFFVATLRSLQAHDIPFVFADRHAIMRWAKFSTSLDDLGHLASERYQAEALVYRHLPAEHIDAIVCGTMETKVRVSEMVRNCSSQIEVVSRKLWFF